MTITIPAWLLYSAIGLGATVILGLAALGVYVLYVAFRRGKVMSHSSTCCARYDACSECHAQEIAKRDEDIAALNANNKEMCVERFDLVKEISTLHKALNAFKSMEDCDNCKHSSKNIAEYPCNICDEGTDKWEAK